MLVTDLIKKLEELIESHKAVEEMMGPAEIMIDVFKLVKVREESGKLKQYRQYAGFSPDIKIERSDDGVYPILSGFLE